MNTTDILNTLPHDTLTALLTQYSEYGVFPIELFLLKADYSFTAKEIEEMWKRLYEHAAECEKERDDIGAYYLEQGAEMCLEQIKKLPEKEQKTICEMLIKDLTKASEEDGIGMYTDSEWTYLEVCERIQNDF